MKLIRLLPFYLATCLITFAIGLAPDWFLTSSEAEISPGLPIDVSPKSPFKAGSGMGGAGSTACRGVNRTFDDGYNWEAAESKGKTSGVRITLNSKATYTDEARRNNLEGSVLLKVTLLACGKVGGVSVVRGLPDGLNEKAIEAARQIRFEPKRVNGQPVSVTKTLEYTFTID